MRNAGPTTRGQLTVTTGEELGQKDREYYQLVIKQLLEALGMDVEKIRQMLGSMDSRKGFPGQIAELQHRNIIDKALADKLTQINALRKETGVHEDRINRMEGKSEISMMSQGQTHLNFTKSQHLLTPVSNIGRIERVQLSEQPTFAQKDTKTSWNDEIEQRLRNIEGRFDGPTGLLVQGAKQILSEEMLAQYSAHVQSGLAIDVDSFAVMTKRCAKPNAAKLLERVTQATLRNDFGGSSGDLTGALQNSLVQDLQDKNAALVETIQGLSNENKDLATRLDRAAAELRNRMPQGQIEQLTHKIGQISKNKNVYSEHENSLQALTRLDDYMGALAKDNQSLVVQINSIKTAHDQQLKRLARQITGVLQSQNSSHEELERVLGTTTQQSLACISEIVSSLRKDCFGLALESSLLESAKNSEFAVLELLKQTSQRMQRTVQSTKQYSQQQSQVGFNEPVLTHGIDNQIPLNGPSKHNEEQTSTQQDSQIVRLLARPGDTGAMTIQGTGISSMAKETQESRNQAGFTLNEPSNKLAASDQKTTNNVSQVQSRDNEKGHLQNTSKEDPTSRLNHRLVPLQRIHHSESMDRLRQAGKIPPKETQKVGDLVPRKDLEKAMDGIEALLREIGGIKKENALLRSQLDEQTLVLEQASLQMKLVPKDLVLQKEDSSQFTIKKEDSGKREMDPFKGEVSRGCEPVKVFSQEFDVARDGAKGVMDQEEMNQLKSRIDPKTGSETLNDLFREDIAEERKLLSHLNSLGGSSENSQMAYISELMRSTHGEALVEAQKGLIAAHEKLAFSRRDHELRVEKFEQLISIKEAEIQELVQKSVLREENEKKLKEKLEEDIARLRVDNSAISEAREKAEQTLAVYLNVLSKSLSLDEQSPENVSEKLDSLLKKIQTKEESFGPKKSENLLENDDGAEELKKLSLMLEDLKAKSLRQEKEIQEKMSLIDRLKEAADRSEKIMKNMRLLQTETDNYLKKLEEASQKSQAANEGRIRLLNEEIVFLKINHQKLLDEKSEEVRLLTQTVSSRDEAVTKLNRDLGNLSKENQQLEAKVHSQDIEINQLKEQLLLLEKQSREHKEMVDQMRQIEVSPKVMSIQSQPPVIETQPDQRLLEAEARQKEVIEGMKAQLEQANSEKTRMVHLIEQLKVERDRLEGSSTELRQLLEQQSSEHNDLMQTELERQLAVWTEEREQLSKELQDLRDQNESLVRENNDLMEALTQIDHKINTQEIILNPKFAEVESESINPDLDPIQRSKPAIQSGNDRQGSDVSPVNKSGVRGQTASRVFEAEATEQIAGNRESNGNPMSERIQIGDQNPDLASRDPQSQEEPSLKDGIIYQLRAENKSLLDQLQQLQQSQSPRRLAKERSEIRELEEEMERQDKSSKEYAGRERVARAVYQGLDGRKRGSEAKVCRVCTPAPGES
jgi:hypothetical protein